MKRRAFKHLISIGSLLTAITSLFLASVSARTWTSADGKKTFQGDLISYNAESGDVTVNRDGKRFTFKQQILSAPDIAFLKSAKATPETTPKPVESVAPKSSANVPVNKIALQGNGKPDYTFKPAPFDKRSTWLIKNFGPVGIGIMLEKGPVMKIQNVEPGSPAEKAGNLKQGEIIESINGVKLTDTKRDARLILGDLITEAEATDGKIHLQIKDKGVVTVTIPVLGRYSATWPLNCPKSDMIVRNLPDLLAI
jgi:S1-C subfamily serine protease